MSWKISASAFSLLCLLVLVPGSQALEVKPPDHPAMVKECGACHMVFPPQFLPQRSWTGLMGNLSDHFGEDASLAPEVQADILAYLTANAADAPDVKAPRRLLRGVSSNETPLRITELPWWKRSHDEISAARFSKTDIKSPANCMACHRTADKGQYYED